MQTFLRLTHSMPARLAFIVGGLWLVIHAADLPPGSAFLLAAVGTAMAVTGIADISMTELVLNAMRVRPLVLRNARPDALRRVHAGRRIGRD